MKMNEKSELHSSKSESHAYSMGNIFDSTIIRLFIEYLLHKYPVYLVIHL